MTVTVEDVEAQLQLAEDSYWEFKQIEFRANRPVAPKRDDLADEIAAFANADGGILVCGVTDDGDAQGLSREQLVALDALIAAASADSIKPPVSIRTSHRQLSNGKAVLVVEVPKGESQHDSPGGSFVRVAASKRRMTTDARLRLAERRNQARFLWFDKQPVPNTGFQTLDEALWKPLLSAEGRLAPETALDKLALLITDDEGALRATVAGVLLCNRSPERWLPNACITATHYRGDDRASGQFDNQTITGPLQRQVADAMGFAVRNMRVGAYKDPARMNLPQYSVEALFEALVNAVAHRDYSIRGSRIRLSMFSDRVEINSPGELANNLTIDSMVSRQATRNEAIASVLGRMPVAGIPGSDNRRFFMERRGDGVPIILRQTRALCGTPPEYRVLDDADLFLTIPAAATEATPATVTLAVHHDGRPVAGADLLVLFPDTTYRQGTTDGQGQASVRLYSTNLPMTVFVAARGFRAHVEREWIPSRGAFAVNLEQHPKGGAMIFPEATGSIPGLGGWLNPVRDPHDRTCLYASNLAINQGQEQPVHFSPGEELQLTDAEGASMGIRILEVMGRSALIEYRVVR